VKDVRYFFAGACGSLSLGESSLPLHERSKNRIEARRIREYIDIYF
jgi:hypothetical protein